MTISLTSARDALQRADALLATAKDHLRDNDVDAVQTQIYDLAFSTAELQAAHELVAFAAEEGADAEFREQIAIVFCGDALTNLNTRLSSRPSAYGLAVGPVDHDVLAFIDAALAPSRLTDLGNTIRDRDGRLPDDRLDNEKSMMRDTLRQFAEDVVMPRAESIHREDRMIPDEILDGLRELGCFGLSVPARFGGLKPDDDEDSLGMVVVTEELSRGSLGAAGSLITRPEIMARALLEGGTPEQQARWFPGLAAGDPLCAISVTEPGTGSDVASVALRATKTDGGWVLNGGKTWCTFAGKAGVILVLARTDAEIKPPHRGLSLFVIEKPSTDAHDFVFDNPRGGSLSGRAIATIGYRGMHSFEMFYDDFFVPDDALVGEESGVGKGFYYTMRGFSGGRLQTAARACGLMRAAFEKALRYAEERRVFDQPVASYQLTLAKLAKMVAYITACQRFAYSVADLMDRDEGQLDASLVKLLACKVAEWVTREALQIHGGMGYAEETDVSRYFADARVLSIFEGAEETLALKVVGKSLIS